MPLLQGEANEIVFWVCSKLNIEKKIVCIKFVENIDFAL